MLDQFGFDNTYALAMKADRADALGIRRISDIVSAHRDLKVVVSHEFLQTIRRLARTGSRLRLRLVPRGH